MAKEMLLTGGVCPPRLIVDCDYCYMDTGGTEAMTQLALAMFSLCPNVTYRGMASGRNVINPLGRIAPRLLAYYPALANLPRLPHTDALRTDDVVIVPETRACDEVIVNRGV